MADAQDLKSWDHKKSCGFESHHRHQCNNHSVKQAYNAVSDFGKRLGITLAHNVCIRVDPFGQPSNERKPMDDEVKKLKEQIEELSKKLERVEDWARGCFIVCAPRQKGLEISLVAVGYRCRVGAMRSSARPKQNRSISCRCRMAAPSVPRTIIRRRPAFIP